MNDRPIFDYLNTLAAEEEMLWEHAGDGDGLDAMQQQRLEWIRVELDQCYDLLHQRQDRRSAGLNLEDARVQSAEVVER